MADLVKYLVSVRDTLTAEEISKLKKTAAFPLEVKGVNQPTANHDTATVVKAKIERRMPSQLYEPTDTLRSLGLPLLDWGNAKWKPTSEEGKRCWNCRMYLSSQLSCCFPSDFGGFPQWSCFSVWLLPKALSARLHSSTFLLTWTHITQASA